MILGSLDVTSKNFRCFEVQRLLLQSLLLKACNKKESERKALMDTTLSMNFPLSKHFIFIQCEYETQSMCNGRYMYCNCVFVIELVVTHACAFHKNS